MVCLAGIVAVSTEPQPVKFHDGDVVLQASRSERAALIRKASRSAYSHVGLIEVASDGVYVIEAVQPVSRTPLAKWVARGIDGRLTVLRFKGLTEEEGTRVVREAKRALGRPYDARYRWDDARLYCSELVAKAFARGAGKAVGRQEVLGELALSAEELKQAPALGLSVTQTLLTPQSLADDAQFEHLAEWVVPRR